MKSRAPGRYFKLSPIEKGSFYIFSTHVVCSSVRGLNTYTRCTWHENRPCPQSAVVFHQTHKFLFKAYQFIIGTDEFITIAGSICLQIVRGKCQVCMFTRTSKYIGSTLYQTVSFRLPGAFLNRINRSLSRWQNGFLCGVPFAISSVIEQVKSDHCYELSSYSLLVRADSKRRYSIRRLPAYRDPALSG